MKELLNNLIKLQEIDSHILSKRRFIEKVPYRILEKDLPLKQAQAELEKMQQKNEALNKKKRDKEKRLDEIHEKIKKMKSRTADIKTNKEYQAHLKEIESSEKEISGIEESILLIMDEFDNLSRLQKDKEVNVKAERAKLDAMREELDREAAQYERELSLIKEERAALVSSIDPDDYKLYKRLIENCNGVAVAEAKNEVCGGCNMNVPPQLFVEIRKNEELLQCPQCYRILYYSEE